MEKLKRLWLFILCVALSVLAVVAAEHTLFAPKPPPPPVLVDARPNVDPDVQLLVAVHEAGHAVAAAYLRGPESVSGIDLFAKFPKSQMFGQVRMRWRPELNTRDSMMRDIVITLAGRAADVIVNGAANEGAASDLRNATNTLVTMHVRVGLAGKLLVRDRDDVPESTRAQMERELQSANACAEAVITANRDAVLHIAGALLAAPADAEGRRTLSADDFANLLDDVSLKPLSEAVQSTHISQCAPVKKWKPDPQMCPNDLTYGPPPPPGFVPK